MTPYNIFESESIGQKVGLVLGNQQLVEEARLNWEKPVDFMTG